MSEAQQPDRVKEVVAPYTTASRRSLLTAFTPSLMDERQLRAIFVARQPLVSRIVRDIGDATTSEARRHALLVGPRGIGKTHLVSIVYYTVRDNTELYSRLRVAWLREEEWSVFSYADLLVQIFRALANEYPTERQSLHAFADKLRRLPVDEGEKIGEAELLSFLKDRLLLLIAENINDLFTNMGVEGQQSLRAFLQNHSDAVLVTTSPALTDDLSSHDAPFYGFFNTTHLKELTRPEANALLSHVAREAGDTELIEYLKTDEADRRLRVIEALAGGHPRIWILFSACMSRQLLDELVPLFVKMLDDLTPYYQERMRFLPPQERRIVAYLCEVSGAVPVREIAEACRIKPNAVAALLGKLEEKAYVRVAPESPIASTGDRRITYYEMREPLMRLCIEVKENRAEPLKLIVEFLRLWFTKDDIQLRLKMLQDDADLTRRYLQAALERINRINTEAFILLKQALDRFRSGNIDEALTSTNQSLKLRPDKKIASATWHFRHVLLKMLDEPDAASASLEEAIISDLSTSFHVLCLQLLLLPPDDFYEQLPHIMKTILGLDQASALNYGLVNSISLLVSERVTEAVASHWLSAWSTASEDHPEMDVAMRLLRAAVEWKRTRDRGALLRLPSEERAVLEDIIQRAMQTDIAKTN